jgi:hypothetical protein
LVGAGSNHSDFLRKLVGGISERVVLIAQLAQSRPFVRLNG